MDMLALQCREVLGKGRARQAFASDAWRGARLFIRGNDATVPIFPDVRTRPFPAERLHLYAAGPPLPALGARGQETGHQGPEG